MSKILMIAVNSPTIDRYYITFLSISFIVVYLQKNLRYAASGQVELIQYPKIEDLVFRHNDDFVGGLWTDFEKHWQRFIDEIRYL